MNTDTQTQTETPFDESPEPVADSRVAELLDKYEHLFWDHAGSGIGRNSGNPAEVSTEWAPNEIHASRGYKKGDNPFPPGYVRADKAALAGMDEKRLENVKANIECMSANGMSTAEISDVLRVLENDVRKEQRRLMRERM